MLKNIINIIILKLNNERNSYCFKFINNSELILKKILEEFFEILQIFNNYKLKKNCFNRYFLIKEICDFLFHIILFIVINKINILEINKEFFRRINLSGMKEKRNRYK